MALHFNWILHTGGLNQVDIDAQLQFYPKDLKQVIYDVSHLADIFIPSQHQSENSVTEFCHIQFFFCLFVFILILKATV